MSVERTILRTETADGLGVVADLCRRDEARANVVLVHGLGFSRRHWRGQVDALCAAGFSVLAPDLRGFGESTLPGEVYDMATLAADVEALRASAGFERFHLVGHSMGGMVAQSYLVDQPDRVVSAVLASTTSHNGRRASAFARAMAALSVEGFDAAVADADKRAAVEAMVKEIAPYVGPVMDMLRELTRDADPARAFAWQAIAGFSLREQVKTIACPTLVMHGTADQNVPFAAGRLLHEAIADSRWLPLDGVGHNLPLEQTERFNEEVLRFLDGVS